MNFYPTLEAPYVPQQPVNPYGGMGTVGLVTPLPNTQMQQTQPQRPHLLTMGDSCLFYPLAFSLFPKYGFGFYVK